MNSEKFDSYYDYLDQKMVEGDELAEHLIEKYGYSIEDSVLYNYVFNKSIEGDEKAIKLINSD